MALAVLGFLMTTSPGTRAIASPIVTYKRVNLAEGSASFGFGNGAATYTLSGSGDIFNPVAVITGGTALVNSFGGIPVAPTTNFIDRGTVMFDNSGSYSALPTTTTISNSNGSNFLGLKFTLSDGFHFGFSAFTGTVLSGL